MESWGVRILEVCGGGERWEWVDWLVWCCCLCSIDERVKSSSVKSMCVGKWIYFMKEVLDMVRCDCWDKYIFENGKDGEVFFFGFCEKVFGCLGVF